MGLKMHAFEFSKTLLYSRGTKLFSGLIQLIQLIQNEEKKASCYHQLFHMKYVIMFCIMAK